MPNDLDTELPISLKHLQDVVERVSKRYPHIPSYQIALITRSFFQTLRELLFEHEGISISGLFTRFHLISYSRNDYDNIQVSLNTPRNLRK